MNATGTVVVAIVGIDGCGKSSAWRGALGALALQTDVVGIGDEVVAGAPGDPLHPRSDLPLARMTRQVTGVAKRTRLSWAYRQLKTLDLIGRSRMRDHVVDAEMPSVLLTDGDPLVNTMAWSVGRLHRDQLGRDDLVLETLDYLSGERRIPRWRMSYFVRHSLPLVLINRLGLARFSCPDLVVRLSLDGATAMERIRARGQTLQGHETETALTALDAGYERICALLETRRGVHVVRIAADRTAKDEVARLVAEMALGPCRVGPHHRSVTRRPPPSRSWPRPSPGRSRTNARSPASVLPSKLGRASRSTSTSWTATARHAP